MPYVLDDEDDKKDGSGTAGSGAAGVAQGGITSSGMAQTAAPTPGQSAPGASTSPYVEFGRYLSANKAGADASANKLGDSIESGGQDVQKQLGDQRTAFNKQVEAGKPTYLQQAPPQSGGGLKPAGAPQAGQATYKPPAAPGTINATSMTAAPVPRIEAPTPGGLQGTPVGGTPDATITPEEAKTRAHATYTGPNAMSDSSDWAGLLDKGDQAQRRANLTSQRTATGALQGDSGIQTLLQEGHAGAGANYNQGQSRFDAALTGAVGRGRFGQLQGQYGDLSTSLKNADNQSKSTALSAKMATEASGQDYAGALDDYDIARQASAAGVPASTEDTSGAPQGRADWGQMDRTHYDAGPNNPHSSETDGGRFSEFTGGDQNTYEHMTQNQWGQFNQLYAAAKQSGDWSAVSAYVQSLNSQYASGQVKKTYGSTRQ